MARPEIIYPLAANRQPLTTYDLRLTTYPLPLHEIAKTITRRSLLADCRTGDRGFVGGNFYCPDLG
ncbi:hypothetical protein [Scytonema millei]|uniref:hypothetical protein n=1 Tax=Scytonema millei TaxID=1245922 RepID=UPI002852E824|nr:hypothetical protein [Scytonema millei]